jgi:predicted O-methyltransferase YrrM
MSQNHPDVFFGTLQPPPISDKNSAQYVKAAVELSKLYTPPADLSGRGIVICGGGRYLPSVYVSVRLLRELGCALPIQIWHLGDSEVPENAAALFLHLNVEFKDARKLVNKFSHKRLGGWELKAFALLHCPWREVLLLDADNLALKNPTCLFDDELYKEHGALFWPDRGRWPADSKIWELTGIAYRDEAEFESGQIAVDRARCWSALTLSNWFNVESAYWYSKIHGDKDTFRLAWRALSQEYGMIPHMGSAPWPYFYQKDAAGAILFHHGLKWDTIAANNARLEHVPAVCYSYIEDYILALTDAAAQYGPKPKQNVELPIETGAAAHVAVDPCHVDHIYGVARALKPAQVLEFGLGTGATANAILRALRENNRGQLTLVDNWHDFGGQQPDTPTLRQNRLNVVAAAEGLFVKNAAPVYDMIISDADHYGSHTWWEDTLRLVRPGGCVFYHDVTFSGAPNLRTIYDESRQKYAVQLFNASTTSDERCERGLLCVWRPETDVVRPRVAVLQYGSGSALELLKYSRPCHENACARFGYDYIFEGEPKSNRHPVWEKPRMFRETLAAGYDYVIWLDADSFWLGACDLLTPWASAAPAAVLAGTWHSARPGAGHYYNHLNIGVLFARQGNGRAVELCDRWIAMPDNMHPWREQHSLHELLAAEPDLVHFIDHAWNSVEWVPEYCAQNPVVVSWHGNPIAASARIKQLSEEYSRRYDISIG